MTESDVRAGNMGGNAPDQVEDYDVIILGAGINGAGLFRELSLQGVNCLIVDKADFGSGTSAAPSRLIHGGIKYLETGEFGLVSQSTLERNLLLKNAPHCVEPLPTFIPSFSLMKGAWAALRTLLGSTTAPRSRGALLIKIGLALYDIYGARHRVMPKHQFLFRQAALREMPEVTPRIVAGGIYYDARITRPERLVWELIKDGLDANPQSRAENFVTLEGRDAGILRLRDSRGAVRYAQGRIVVNAAGPWIDHVNATLGVSKKLVGGTKGSHILLDHPDLVKSLKGRMIYFEADDGRICLVYEAFGLALVGSTDIKADNPDTVKCEEDEIDYFLESLKSLLPRLSFSRGQIVYAYSGIRPLPASDASEPGLISRDHSSPTFEPTEGRPFALVSLVGGKWTTFRGFAEEVADSLLSRLSKKRIQGTQALPIGGGRDFPTEPAARRRWVEKKSKQSGLSAERVEALLGRYGTTADQVIAHLPDASNDAPLTHLPDFSTGEIAWLARSEMVVHLADLIMRRTTLAIEGRMTAAVIDELSLAVARTLGWDEVRRRDEISALTGHLATYHRVRL